MKDYKYCAKCGEKLRADEVYCPNCGTKQAPVAVNQAGTGTSIKETNFKPYNETANPGLIPSTKLFFNDLFTTDKCMGRADFWWSYLGVTLILDIVCFILGFLNGATAALVIVLNIIQLLLYIPAQIRRLHDVGKSGWNYCWVFTGIGSIYVLYLLIIQTNWQSNQWPRPTNN